MKHLKLVPIKPAVGPWSGNLSIDLIAAILSEVLGVGWLRANKVIVVNSDTLTFTVSGFRCARDFGFVISRVDWKRKSPKLTMQLRV